MIMTVIKPECAEERKPSFETMLTREDSNQVVDPKDLCQPILIVADGPKGLLSNHNKSKVPRMFSSTRNILSTRPLLAAESLKVTLPGEIKLSDGEHSSSPSRDHFSPTIQIRPASPVAKKHAEIDRLLLGCDLIEGNCGPAGDAIRDFEYEIESMPCKPK